MGCGETGREDKKAASEPREEKSDRIKKREKVQQHLGWQEGGGRERSGLALP